MRLLLRNGFLGALLLLLAGCESAPAPRATAKTGAAHASDPALSWVALERSGGSGLLYRVTLYIDGSVLFEGARNSVHPGSSWKHLSPASADRVFRQIELANFWDRYPRYDVERSQRGGDSIITATAPPDALWDGIVAQHRGRSKRIDGLFFAPRELLELKTFIEETVGLADWLAGAKP